MTGEVVENILTLIFYGRGWLGIGEGGLRRDGFELRFLPAIVVKKRP